MPLRNWRPHNELDQLFPDHSFGSSQFLSRLGLDLAVDVYEEDGSIVAKTSVPGIMPEDIDVTIEGDTLTISGRREEEAETDTKDYFMKEIRRGSFVRSVRLPRAVHAPDAAAEYRNGVLTIRVPALARAADKSVRVPVS